MWCVESSAPVVSPPDPSLGHGAVGPTFQICSAACAGVGSTPAVRGDRRAGQRLALDVIQNLEHDQRLAVAYINRWM